MSSRVADERSLLGCALLDPVVIDEHGHTLLPLDWFRPQHAELWDRLRQLRDDPQYSRMDAGWTDVILMHAFDWGDAVEGPAYVAGLMSAAPSIEAAPTFAARCKGHAQTEAVKQAATRLLEALKAGTPTADALAVHEAALEAVRHRDSLERSGWVHVGDTASTVYDETANAANDPSSRTRLLLPTGWHGIDRLVGGGLRPGEVTILAGRPGAGKTAAAMQIAQRASAAGAVGIFSLEMTRAALATREMARLSKVPLTVIQHAGPNAGQWRDLNHAVADLMDRPIWIDDSPALHVAELRARARRLTQIAAGKGIPIALLVVDYLQLALATVGKNANREQEVAAVSKAVKIIAKELRCPIVALAQMNRDVERRVAERPKKSDLRESGQIEQDAQNIVFVHRDPDEEDETLRELVVAKARDGVEGVVPMRWAGEYQTLIELDTQHEAPVREQPRSRGWADGRD